MQAGMQNNDTTGDFPVQSGAEPLDIANVIVRNRDFNSVMRSSDCQNRSNKLFGIGACSYIPR